MSIARRISSVPPCLNEARFRACGVFDEPRVVAVEVGDHRAGRLAPDPQDQTEGTPVPG